MNIINISALYNSQAIMYDVAVPLFLPIKLSQTHNDPKEYLFNITF